MDGWLQGWMDAGMDGCRDGRKKKEKDHKMIQREHTKPTPPTEHPNNKLHMN